MDDNLTGSSVSIYLYLRKMRIFKEMDVLSIVDEPATITENRIRMDANEQKIYEQNENENTTTTKINAL